MPAHCQTEMYDDRNPLAKWRITHSWIEEVGVVGDERKKTPIDVVGPRTCPPDEDDHKFKWTEFRIYDDDGELYYEGIMNEHCEGLDPLDDFGTPNAGATELRIKVKDQECPTCKGTGKCDRWETV